MYLLIDMKNTPENLQEDALKNDEQQEQIATLQASVQQLYATLQDYASKYSALYEENKALKEKYDAKSSLEQVTEVSQEEVKVSDSEPLLQGPAPQTVTQTVEQPLATVVSDTQQATMQGTNTF